MPERERTPSPAPEHPAEGADVMHLLEDGVPIALLADLGDPEGPRSEEILEAEGAPDDEWWVQDAPEK